MVAEMVPERDFRGPGCSVECHVVRALIPGVFGRSELLLHDPESHEAYGRGLAHASGSDLGLVVTGPLVVNIRRMEVLVGGSVAHVTPTEMLLLVALARYPGGCITTKELLTAVWGEAEAGLRLRWQSQAHLLRVNMTRLRKNLRDAGALITTLYGIGYRLEMIEAGADPPASRRQGRPDQHFAWSLRYPNCIACGSEDRPHVARGYCHRCYWQQHRGGAFTGGAS